ncbi:hypothetical protein V8D89_008965, partial [Ganoderma adspersum]
MSMSGAVWMGTLATSLSILPIPHKVSAGPSVVRPLSGRRRSRTSHSGSHPRRESLHCAGEEVDESTPFWCSRLSGMGDSDCAEWACLTARLSLRLPVPGSSTLDVTQ